MTAGELLALGGFHGDMIIRMNLRTQRLAGQICNNLVCVHVGTGAGSRLKNVDWKLGSVFAAGNSKGRRLNGNCLVTRQKTQFCIRSGGGPLDESEGRDKSPRHRYSAYREIITGALGLRTPKRILWYLEFTHAVTHGP